MIERSKTFYWRPEKAALVRQERRIVQEDVEAAYRDPYRYETFDDREDYGEDRYIVTGMAGTKLITFVYTERGDAIHIITAWRASRAEAKDYETGL